MKFGQSSKACPAVNFVPHLYIIFHGNLLIIETECLQGYVAPKRGGSTMTRRFLTASQVADLLQIQERTVNRWLRTGYLRGFKVGKEWRIRAGDLEGFLEMHANHEQPLVVVESGNSLLRTQGSKNGDHPTRH